MSSLYPWHLHTVIFSYTFPSSAVTVTVTGFPTCRGPTMSLKFSSEVCLCHLPASYISHSTCSHSALDLVSIWNMLGTKSIRQSHNILMTMQLQCNFNYIRKSFMVPILENVKWYHLRLSKPHMGSGTPFWSTMREAEDPNCWCLSIGYHSLAIPNQQTPMHTVRCWMPLSTCWNSVGAPISMLGVKWICSELPTHSVMRVK